MVKHASGQYTLSQNVFRDETPTINNPLSKADLHCLSEKYIKEDSAGQNKTFLIFDSLVYT